MKKSIANLAEQSTQITDPMGLSRTTLSRTQKSFLKGIKPKLTQKVTTETDEETSQANTVYLAKTRYNSKQGDRGSQTSRMMRHYRQLTRVSENFNVYKVPDTLQMNPEVLLFKSKHFKYVRDMITFYVDDLKSIKEQQYSDENIYQKISQQYYSEAWNSLENLIVQINSLILHRCNRERFEQEMKNIIMDAFKSKNIVIQQRISYLFGKIEQLFYNPISAVYYFKICKRLSDTNQYYRQKMKAYRGLGQCLMRIRPSLSQLYLTKYLMSAWKLNEKNDEFLAYDLLGKYYYYIGQIDKARIYHEKMITGHGEEIDSRVRVLACSRLEQGSIGTCSNKDYLVNEIDIVTSDDECYDLVFQEPTRVQIITNLNTKQNSIIFKKKLPDRRIIREEANNNIRQKKKKFNSQLLDNPDHDISKLQISSPHLSIGQIKDKVLLSHMTPNRKLEMYQYICLSNDKNGNLNTNQITGLYDRYETNKILKYISSLVVQLKNTQSWIYSQQKNYSNSFSQQRRKAQVIK